MGEMVDCGGADGNARGTNDLFTIQEVMLIDGAMLKLVNTAVHSLALVTNSRAINTTAESKNQRATLGDLNMEIC